ncbi:MAG: ammonia-forming cytochrome c nitrite reductase subunit c552 [Opitutae bacterium]|nr:ammonia-forming cytochrome c nitrite reductase subunit c552 [Opitutae bacterium]
MAAPAEQTSASCRACHEKAFAAWSGTDHALANRPIDPAGDAAALATFAPPPGIGPGTAPEMVLGRQPLWQPLLPAPGGRWQPHELAFDPAKQEWFNVFGAEARRPGEWGHWTGRGMNWNSMCAQCHMTGYRKNYDAASDRYRSTWVEHGVGCVQCHGPVPRGHGAPDPGKKSSTAPFRGDRQLMMQACASCHARHEPLTENFQPGDRYDDHYRVALPVEPGLFFPDGQQRDEDFNWTSVLLSRMGRAGVTCLDCHDPHTTKTILPTARNELCLQCHAAPGRVQPNGTRAVVIDPVAHSHHAEGSAGNSCVACHMPATTYLQRAPRHDHGWLKPDPLLTKELGIPNACNRCHADKPAEWASAASEIWYGAKMESRQRARARAVAAAQAGRPEAAGALLALLKNEDVPAWRATYLGLLAADGDNAAVPAEAVKALRAPEAVERAAAVRLLAGGREPGAALTPLLQDPARLVRLDAAWALAPTLAAGSPERRELEAYLALSLDQPAGRLRAGQDLANRGDLAGAEKEIAQAAAWDPQSPVILDAHGLVLAGLGRPAEAAEKFSRAAGLAPADAPVALRAALALAEAGQWDAAEKMFRLAVARDPRFDRAWYNLGLLLAQRERLADAAEALRRAEAAAPAVADYPYALATVLLRAGDPGGARAAAQRALTLAPGHPGARQILRATP